MSQANISEAEKKYKALLLEKCSALFSEADIPSHDAQHHARVWGYAKEIIGALDAAGMVSDHLIAEKVIIAVWLHDTGLTLNTGPDHGKESRNICNDFLITHHVPEEYHHEILQAVENHDDKSYASASDPASAAAILSVADDMDAFGYVGVLRYSEIYSMRNIPLSDMSVMIITNAKSRFKHLETTYKMFPAFVEEQRERLEIIVSFYRSLEAGMQRKI